MSKPLELTGQRFGRLIARQYLGVRKRRGMWLCDCDCGKTKEVPAIALSKGNTKSCGCLRRETMSRIGKTNRRHTHHGSPTYRSWITMRQRCNDPNVPNYNDYGGRGITVCPQWDSFETFLADMGERPSLNHSIERKDSNGNYEPDNCRWATAKEQQNNTRASVRVRIGPRLFTVGELAELLNVSTERIRGIAKRGGLLERLYKS